jgi:hypothetical protein
MEWTDVAQIWYRGLVHKVIRISGSIKDDKFYL